MTLSPRQMEIARLVADDLSDKEIANILRISERTVQSHLERIAMRLNACDSALSRRRFIARYVEGHGA
ncbi:MAG: helix-turn-helix domain-containing protein [Methylocystis sp.]|uniref:helix-turn-helix domain-containing protein n=1 Tax=Methylocystis sp. TaxID=1911079 RepID=UPI003DA1CFCE